MSKLVHQFSRVPFVGLRIFHAFYKKAWNFSHGFDYGLYLRIIVCARDSQYLQIDWLFLSSYL